MPVLALASARAILTWRARHPVGQNRRLTADFAAFVLSGMPAVLFKGSRVAAGVGLYTLTGQPANLRRDYPMVAGFGAYNIAGQGATLSTSAGGVILSAAFGAFALTGQPAGLLLSTTLIAAVGSFALTGQPAGLTVAGALTAAVGTYTLSGQAAGLKIDTPLAASVGVYALSGQAAALKRDVPLVAGLGSYTITGESMTPTVEYVLPAGLGTYAVAGQAAALTVTNASPVLTAAVGSYALTGQDAALKRDVTLTAAAGIYALNGQSANLSKAGTLAAAAGSYVISGEDATLTYSGAGGGDAAWTTAFLARTSGLNTLYTNAVKAFMNTLATAGLDAKVEVMHILALPGTNANLNLKSSSYTLTNHGATHTDGLGYTGDGTAYLDTGFSPLTNRVVSGPSNFSMGFVQAGSADYDNGAGICIDNGDFHNFLTMADFGSAMSGYALSYGFGGGSTTPYGMALISHPASGTFTAYQNTTQQTNTTTATGLDSDFSAGNLCYLGGANVGPSVGPIGLAFQMAGLSSGEVTTLFNAAYTLLHTINSSGYP